MDALTIISQEHSNMWRLATTLDQVASDMQAISPSETAFFEAALDYITQFVDRMHHPKEDDFLFRLLRLRSTEAADVLDALEADHRQGPENLAQLRAKLAESGIEVATSTPEELQHLIGWHEAVALNCEQSDDFAGQTSHKARAAELRRSLA